MATRIFKNLPESVYTDLKKAVPDAVPYQLAVGVSALMDACFLPITFDSYDATTGEIRFKHADPRFAELDKLNDAAIIIGAGKLDPGMYDTFQNAAQLINGMYGVQLAQRPLDNLASIHIKANAINIENISQSAGRMRDLIAGNKGVRDVMAELKTELVPAIKKTDYEGALLVAKLGIKSGEAGQAVNAYFDLCDVVSCTSHADVVTSFPVLPFKRGPQDAERFLNKLHNAGRLFATHGATIRTHVNNPSTLAKLKDEFAIDPITSAMLSILTPASLEHGLSHWENTCCAVYQRSSEKLFAAQTQARNPDTVRKL